MRDSARDPARDSGDSWRTQGTQRGTQGISGGNSGTQGTQTTHFGELRGELRGHLHSGWCQMIKCEISKLTIGSIPLELSSCTNTWTRGGVRYPQCRVKHSMMTISQTKKPRWWNSFKYHWAQNYLQTKITDCMILMSRRGSRFLNCGTRRLILLSPSIINFINFITNKQINQYMNINTHK